MPRRNRKARPLAGPEPLTDCIHQRRHCIAGLFTVRHPGTSFVFADIGDDGLDAIFTRDQAQEHADAIGGYITSLESELQTMTETPSQLTCWMSTEALIRYQQGTVTP